MPELPEVETIRASLAAVLPGQKVADVKVLFDKAAGFQPDDLKVAAIGATVSGLSRRGKVLFIELGNGHTLLVHLKMTGQVLFVGARGRRVGGGHPTKSLIDELPDKSTRIIVGFESGDKLFFNDQRKFGWIKVLPTDRTHEHELLARMGEEPLSDSFTVEELRRRTERRNSNIKAVLLDQTTVAGLGNIYVDEVLHLARIHPLRLASSLTDQEMERLHAAIKTIIRKAIGLNGTTFTSYVDAHGEKGNYLEHARVFRRQGQPCPECGAMIEKIRVAGRGTHFCSSCQPL